MEDSAQTLQLLLARTAHLRTDLAAIRVQLALKRWIEERKHNPNWSTQPRAPRGASDGGQWIDGSLSHTEDTGHVAPIATDRNENVHDTNGLPTPGWAEPDWDYPAFPHTSQDGDQFRMSAEAELAVEAALGAYNAVEALNYRRVMGRSAEDSYEMLLIDRGVEYFRSVPVMTREGLRIYDFLELGPHGWEFVEIKANRAIATPRQIRIDTAVQIFGFSIDFGRFEGMQGPTNVRLRRAIPSDYPSSPEW